MSNRVARSLAWAAVVLAFSAPFFSGWEQVSAAAQPVLAASSSAVTPSTTEPALPEVTAATPTTTAAASSSAPPAASTRSVDSVPAASASRATKASKPTSETTQPQPSPAQTTALAATTPADSGVEGRAQVVSKATPFRAAGATRRGGPVTTLPTPSTVVGPVLPPPVVQDAPGVVTARTDLAASVLALTNQQRLQAGLPALALNSCTSSRIAQPWAIHMATVQRSYHSAVHQVLSSCGGVTAGENISSGWTSPEAAVAAWMGSPAHRANILNRSFTTIGIGIAQAPDGTFYWVQSFNG